MFKNNLYLQGIAAESRDPIPTFSEGGWIRPIGESLDFALAHTFAADKSQSTLYQGHVVSMAALYQQHGNNPDILVQRMQEALDDHLNTYFENVTVEVKHDADTVLTNGYNVYCYVESVTNGKTYTSSCAVTLKDSRLIKFFKLSNTGQL